MSLVHHGVVWRIQLCIWRCGRGVTEPPKFRISCTPPSCCWSVFCLWGPRKSHWTKRRPRPVHLSENILDLPEQRSHYEDKRRNIYGLSNAQFFRSWTRCALFLVFQVQCSVCVARINFSQSVSRQPKRGQNGNGDWQISQSQIPEFSFNSNCVLWILGAICKLRTDFVW